MPRHRDDRPRSQAASLVQQMRRATSAVKCCWAAWEARTLTCGSCDQAPPPPPLARSADVCSPISGLCNSTGRQLPRAPRARQQPPDDSNCQAMAPPLLCLSSRDHLQLFNCCLEMMHQVDVLSTVCLSNIFMTLVSVHAPLATFPCQAFPYHSTCVTSASHKKGSATLTHGAKLIRCTTCPCFGG
jgi:hypothetical protein